MPLPTKPDFAAGLRSEPVPPAAQACELLIWLACGDEDWRWVKVQCESLLKEYPLDGFMLVHAALADLRLEGAETARARLIGGLESGAGPAIHERMVCDGGLDKIWGDILRERRLDRAVIEYQRQLEADALGAVRQRAYLPRRQKGVPRGR